MKGAELEDVTPLQAARLREAELGYGRGPFCDLCAGEDHGYEVEVFSVDRFGVARCVDHTDDLLVGLVVAA